MVGTGALIERASRATHIDDAFALAVWWAETNDGMAGVGLGDRNPGSVRGNGTYPVAYDGYTVYPSYAAAITEWFNLLHNRYIGQGATTVYSISGPYVGTSGSGSWAYKVVTLMARYRNEAPSLPDAPIHPQAAPTAQPTPQTRAYLPIGNEQNWEQRASEKRHHPWLDQEAETSNQTSGPQRVPLQNTREVINPVIRPDEPSDLQQPLLIGGVMLLSILLAYSGLRLRHRRIIAVSGTKLRTSTAPVEVSRHTTTEKLVPVPPTPMLIKLEGVPPTPMLATIGSVPLTPYLPNHDGAASYPSRGESTTEKLPSIAIGNPNGSTTEMLKLIRITAITLPGGAPVKARNKEGRYLKRFDGNPENA
ncbi:hypothetical protein KDH_47620 [Dictyobacter sp. S3.2.2.5]|uniref:Mannosyl-glycoprotein endo-beta-N-acetylglucosamidase-like domain-containing protein n=2 Tax=Dictyobacter halimunensis TaxID=3026934 RepID=A0ABQ6FZF0_9CHLR|nr:hypothetical protein KDH_47620 [Dictyobacter sp. S3.2.2.5]